MSEELIKCRVSKYQIPWREMLFARIATGKQQKKWLLFRREKMKQNKVEKILIFEISGCLDFPIFNFFQD